MRSRWHVEDQGRGTWIAIVITEIPYQRAEIASLIEKLAELVQTTRSVPLLADVRDESADSDSPRWCWSRVRAPWTRRC